MKKNDKLLKMMNDLDEAYIEEAEKTRFLTKTAGWKRVSSIAASLALVAAICTFPIWGQFDNPEIGHEVNLENLESKEIVWDAKAGVFTLKNYDYKLLSFGGYGTDSTTEATTTTSAELIIEGREDVSVDLKATPNVLYPYITGDYASYTMARGRVMEDKVGEKLGKVTMAGADGKTLSAELYAIAGVDTRCAVAVKYPKYASYCIFYNSRVTFASFAEFKAAYSLDTELYMGCVMVEHTVADNRDCLVEMKGIAPLKEKLLALDGASCTYAEFAARCDMKKSIGFDVAQGAVWNYAFGGLQIFSDGYLVTNLGGGLYIFDIGKDAAREMIADAKANQYVGVNFYDEARDVLIDDTGDDDHTGALPETSGAFQGAPAIDGPYELTTPSYDPHSPASSTEIAEETVATETTTAAPPYMPETTAECVYATNPLIYEGKDPNAMVSETTTEIASEEMRHPVYEGNDPYAMPKETTRVIPD